MKLASRIFKRDDYKITSKFGFRNAIYDNKGNLIAKEGMHNGCDYGTHAENWFQYALEDGVVMSAGKDNTDAIYAWIRYPRLGIELLHYHLSSVIVSTGQSVTKETIVGYTGMTGNATGIHLHLGLRKIGSTQYYDPEQYDYQEQIIITKTIDELAQEVIQGLWGNNPERKEKLIAAGYDYDNIQSKVNELLNVKPVIEDRIYIVEPGDTLSRVAIKCKTTWKRIYANNKELIDSDAAKHGITKQQYNYIYVGQRLVIK